MGKRKRTRGRKKQAPKTIKPSAPARAVSFRATESSRARSSSSPPALDGTEEAVRKIAGEPIAAELERAPLVSTAAHQAEDQSDKRDAGENALNGEAAATTNASRASLHMASPPGATATRQPRDERLPARTRVMVRAVFDGVSRDDEVLNWSPGGDSSPGGVFVHTTDLLAVGDPVVLTFESVGATRPLSMPGRVRWVSPFGRSDDPRPGMGIAFVGASESHRRRLATILQRAPAS